MFSQENSEKPSRWLLLMPRQRTDKDSKINPAPIIEGFRKTLVFTDGRISLRDRIQQYVMPLSVGLISALLQLELSTNIGIAILTLSGLFSAFLFQLTIQVLERAASWNDTRPLPGPETSRHANLLAELSANAAYAALISAATAVAALLASITSSGGPEQIAVVLTLILLSHLGTTLLLVVRRVFLLTVERLNDARTGASNRRSA